ncbi:unnamed protein product [Schistosoma curassoni]|uniref:ING domain-containing protein n=1 Tax=Schistosoma curassoni TaxID=6186 RepID=A0A183KMS3_9TREM|nr:unnamed protein product [Schistosoma curassoni]
MVGLAYPDEATELYWLEQPFLKVLPCQTGRLKSGFDEHIMNTKELLPNILKMEDELHRRLTDLATNVNDLHDQAKKELLAAQFLRNQTNEIEKILNGIEKREKRKTEKHITSRKGDRHEKNEQKLDRTRKEGPGQCGSESAGRWPILHWE